MYLSRFEVRGIKCFASVVFEFSGRGENHSGWNVLLGGNGAGKSTLLQAMAVALVGPVTGQRLLFNPQGWTRDGAGYGEIHADIIPGPFDSSIGQPRKKPYSAGFAVTGAETVEVEGELYDQPQLVQLGKDRKGLSKGPYAANRPGWLACGYGPFRRLTGMGGNEEYALVYSSGRGRRFVTLFREAAAITNCTEWLVSLYSRSIDPSQPESDRERLQRDLVLLQRIINDLLPGVVRIERIDSKDVYFRTVGDVEVAVAELSDGYRSFLAMAIDLLRHVHESIPEFHSVVRENDGRMQIALDGVVLIDEVDAHLHPRWQREIGFRLCRAFPRMQFIVTSHSPFVAQAASDHGIFVLRQPPGEDAVISVQPVASIRGWRVDQILTDRLLFDMEGTRDLETEALMKAHADLVSKREWSHLTTQEQTQLLELESRLASRLTAPGESVAERTQQRAMHEYVNRTLESLKGGR